MKTLILIMSMAALMLMSVGCSKSNSQGADTIAGTTAVVPGPLIIDPIPGGGAAGSSLSGGSTSTFTPVSMAVMNDYVASHPLNDPQNFKINVNLTQSFSGRYGGSVSISYTDNGIPYSGIFNAGTGKNSSYKGLYDNDRPEADYNYWFHFENQVVFTGFFQDGMGAITLTLTPETTSTGGGNDGEPILTTTYKGTISYKNFATSFATQYQRSCWFTYNGPYDCRSNVIQTKCGLTPGAEAGYNVLGTFTGLNVKQAFNIVD